MATLYTPRWFCLFMALLLATSFLKGQDSIPKKPVPDWDTNYYESHTDKFIIGLFQSQRQYDLLISQRLTKSDNGKSALHYVADANMVSGFDFSYDKISLSLALKSKPPEYHALKGKTNYSSLGFTVGGNKWMLETSYRNYKGFYDLNTQNYIPEYKVGQAYFQKSDLQNTSTRLKFMYFFKHQRFSYRAGYSCVNRQKKSSFSKVFVSNLYYNNLSADSSLFPKIVQPYYEPFSGLKSLQTIGISAGMGGSLNFVIFKRFFYNITFLLGLEPQWRTYHYADGFSRKLTYITLSGDLRSAIGYNGKRLYILFSSVNDLTNFDSGHLFIKQKFVSGSFTLGWRFRTKCPKWYQRFMKTKLYSLI